ncbi:MAG: asparagine synthase-related protein, partial [Ignavibacteria bacterium]|nr:asparagine synthase-related protein [Ignavibacteria bacterium]
ELTNQTFSQYILNGHFAAARWNKNKLELFTDQLGIRNIYLTNLNDCIAFSTRLDWLSKLNKKITIDWEEVGACWFLLNQISQKSILKNVERMSQRGKALINLNPLSYQIKNQPWHPNLIPSLSEDKDFISILRDFTLCGLNNDKKISLALSGGLDSRILLALLISSKSKNWFLHSINFPDHPDTKAAKVIAKELNVEHFFWEPLIPPADKIISLLTEYVGETILTTPASKFLLLQFYSTLYNQNKIVIDGGYGEIARRRYLNSLLFKGRNAIYNSKYGKIISLLKYSRSNIFKDDYVQLMQVRMQKQMDEIFHTMPMVKSFGVENWLDLFAIRTRLVHFSVEQSRSDSQLVNFMPFVQPSFLKKLFETKVKDRNNSKLFYKIIKNFSPSLSQIPLVKGGTTYPFGLGSIPSSILIKLKNKLGFYYKDNLVIQFLETLSEYIQDTANSGDVTSCEYYDQKKVKDLVEGFYRKKNLALANEIDWWLTFEIWRRIIERT